MCVIIEPLKGLYDWTKVVTGRRHMLLLKILQWLSYIFVGLCAAYIGFRWIVLLTERRSLNEATKTCLITGASSGIGKAIAVEMAHRGWRVIGIARNEEKLKDVEHELGAVFIPYVCDVSIPEQVHQASEQIKQRQLQPTLFFLNAATFTSADKFKPMFSAHREVFDTNYFGVISWIDEWLNTVKEYGGGTFVAISSINAIFAGPGSAGSGYGAGKAALSSAFRSLRLRYYYDNIGFVDVLPGPVDTHMLKTESKLPFTHKATDEARIIVGQLFKGQQHIEPSWYWSVIARHLNWLPDRFQVK